MILTEAWKRAFPQATAQQVVDHLISTWQDLSNRESEYFCWASKEPDITSRMKEAMEDSAHEVGLTGFWGNEASSTQYDPKTLKRIKGFRTDITYASDREGIHLVFEWKKLTGKSRSQQAYYGASGMGRFLEPSGYAKREPFGVMVAIIESPAHRPQVQSLVDKMRKSESVALLSMIPCAAGHHVRIPSEILPGKAEFDTQHTRITDRYNTFTFGHIFLAFP